jgi:hypothetical protein
MPELAPVMKTFLFIVFLPMDRTARQVTLPPVSDREGATNMRWVLVVLVAAVLVTAAALWMKSRDELPPEPVAEAPPAPVAESHYPVPEPMPTAAPLEPLPQLDGADPAVRADLERELGKTPVEAFLLPTEFLRRFVALVDSLDRHPVPLQFRPVKHVEGVPATKLQGELFILQDEDAKRYAPWVTALQTVDTDKITGLYLRYYPLLQKAYEELGYPGRYFNDRVIKILDHLIATPDFEGPIELVRPKVLFLFADPAIEQRSWGQKTLIRMRPQNATVVKAKLAEIRAVLAANEQKR